MTRTDCELSIAIDEQRVPDGVEAQRGFAALRVTGTLDFTLVGVLAKISAALAGVGIPIFAISTFQTDYILLPASDIEAANIALQRAGMSLVDGR